MGTRDELASLVDAARRHRRPAADRPDAADGPRRATGSPRWPTATCSARSSSPADGAPTWSPAPAPGIGAVARRAAARARRRPGAARPQRASAPPSCAAALPGRRRAGRRPGRPGRRSSGAAAAAARPSSTRVVHVAGVVDLGAGRRARRSTTGASSSTSTWSRRRLLTRVAAAGAARRPRHGRLRELRRRAGRAPDWSAYAASKFGLRALADALRGEEPEHGVRVTTVYPGRTATPMQEKVHEPGGQGVRRRRVDPTRDRGRRDPARARPAARRDDPRPDGRRRRPTAPARARCGPPVQRADQHHPQLGAGLLDDLLLGVGALGARRGSPRRSRPSRSRSGSTAPAGPRADQASVPGSRARSVASSRSNSSISCRIASRTAGGPAARSRAMNRKCARCRCTCSTRIGDRAVDDVGERRVAAPDVAQHRAQRRRTTRRRAPGRAPRSSRSAGRTRSARCRPPWPPGAARARPGCSPRRARARRRGSRGGCAPCARPGSPASGLVVVRHGSMVGRAVPVARTSLAALRAARVRMGEHEGPAEQGGDPQGRRAGRRRRPRPRRSGRWPRSSPAPCATSPGPWRLRHRALRDPRRRAPGVQRPRARWPVGPDLWFGSRPAG